MMDIASLAIFAGALMVAAGSPGPSIAALVARVLSRGAGDVLPFLAAMWIGEAIWLAFAVFGLAALAQTLSWLFLVVKYAGIAYLAYLAWQMWHSPVTKDGAPLAAGTSPWRMFMAGMAVTLGNPKIMVFYLALLPSIIDMRAVDLAGWLELTATMVAVLVFVDLFWVAMAAQARRLLASQRARRVANRTSAAVMGIAAAAMAVR